ncbi:hypothetical protein [Alkalicoccobacillus plakortidis]|uniref:DUF4190 domain-containing protein n=1 Tax=Alkalicoccobacillus plakortidis TaxID=444060 RepID=A0ABT0XQN9_9BACI|nr:hypothetical protein [Alkalicoccobacillus plakortidis]MCM2678045.1 hypothetical protein [Alkalicoccobacillus plakortidis]
MNDLVSTDRTINKGIIFKWFLGIAEASLAFPVFGGVFIAELLWIPLLIMLIMHIIGLKISKKAHLSRTGHILGIITSALGIIPVIGWTLHLITAYHLLYEASMKSKESD